MNHIQNDVTNHEAPRAWCGSTLGSGFYFKDIDQVIINNLHGDRIPCLACLHGVIIALIEHPRHAHDTPAN